MDLNNDLDKLRPVPPELDRLAKNVVDAAFKVHSALGPGLLESIYSACLRHELQNRGVRVAIEVPLPIIYEGFRLDGGLRLDMLIEDELILEIKAVEKMLALHQAQLMSYLKLADKRLGFLINFNVPLFRDGIKRIVQ